MCVRLLLSIPILIFEQNQVSWVRRRDWHILSSGDSLYTNDARFVATHEPTQSTYTLQIKFVQKRDHGIYECQVSDMIDKWRPHVDKQFWNFHPHIGNLMSKHFSSSGKTSCGMNNKILCLFNDENFIFACSASHFASVTMQFIWDFMELVCSESFSFMKIYVTFDTYEQTERTFMQREKLLQCATMHEDYVWWCIILRSMNFPL